ITLSPSLQVNQEISSFINSKTINGFHLRPKKKPISMLLSFPGRNLIFKKKELLILGIPVLHLEQFLITERSTWPEGTKEPNILILQSLFQILSLPMMLPRTNGQSLLLVQ